ncbi:hypothetical protein PVK06_045586 [Gossypium arboreum]|uniref:Uncharacterized protein n=1 Tax=Gossypium arboreum TaxID=29729 RepID=A0ABR0MX21_GOSAR|nr:hypothetical protein PVK06_045586 [Gossypium arboreum]
MDARGTDKAITCPPDAGQHFRRKRHHHGNLDDDSLNMNEIEDRCISLHTLIPYLISLSLQQNQSETNQITLLLHHHQFNRLSFGPMASKLALTLNTLSFPKWPYTKTTGFFLFFYEGSIKWKAALLSTQIVRTSHQGCC